MYAAQICDALQRRRLLRFRYKDRSTPTVVEPYVYGENTSGHMALSAWLLSGETHDSNPPFWRLYLEDEMQAVDVLSEEFSANRKGYNPNDRQFRLVRCRVAPPAA